MSARDDALLHPVRMRIIQVLASERISQGPGLSLPCQGARTVERFLQGVGWALVVAAIVISKPDQELG